MRGQRTSDDLAAVIYSLSDRRNPDTGEHRSARDIGRLLGIHHSVVSRILLRRNGPRSQTKIPLGRPRKTSQRQDARLIMALKRNRFTDLSVHRNSAGVVLSRWTIRRRLLENKYRCHVAVQDLLTPRQKLQRANWCRLQENNINCIEWPPYSPDLNPIENVWGLMKRKLATMAPEQRPTDAQSLMQEFNRIWTSLDETYASQLVDSMSGRLRKVIARRGLRV